MSHTSKIKGAKISDKEVMDAACDRLELPAPKENQDVKFYSGNKAHGTAVQLPNWKYAIVVDENGDIQFDNYGGSWGDQKEIDRFRQAYAIEAGCKIAREQGLRVTEETLENGSIRLEAREVA